MASETNTPGCDKVEVGGAGRRIAAAPQAVEALLIRADKKKLKNVSAVVEYVMIILCVSNCRLTNRLKWTAAAKALYISQPSISRGLM